MYGGDRPLELKNPAQWRGRFVSVVISRPHVRLSDRHLTETAGCPRLTPDLHDIYVDLIDSRGLKIGQGLLGLSLTIPALILYLFEAHTDVNSRIA